MNRTVGQARGAPYGRRRSTPAPQGAAAVF
jgi:hypothetical protein